MDVDGNGTITSVEMRLVLSEILPEHSDLYIQNSFHPAIDIPQGCQEGGGECQKIQEFFEYQFNSWEC